VTREHQPKWGDSIPAFDYPAFGHTPAGHFSGLNLAGQGWLDRSCALPPVVVVDPPTNPVSPAGVVLSAGHTTNTPQGIVGSAIQLDAAAPILAFTGVEILPLGLAGLLALILGAALMAASRRQARD